MAFWYPPKSVMEHYFLLLMVARISNISWIHKLHDNIELDTWWIGNPLCDYNRITKPLALNAPSRLARSAYCELMQEILCDLREAIEIDCSGGSMNVSGNIYFFISRLM